VPAGIFLLIKAFQNARRAFFKMYLIPENSLVIGYFTLMFITKFARSNILSQIFTLFDFLP